MNSLHTTLSQIKNHEDLFKLFENLDRITVERTIFGGRKVTIDNYNGSLSFIKIMDRYNELNIPSIKSHTDYDNEQKINVLNDRIYAIEFRTKIQELQKESPEYKIPEGLFGLISKVFLLSRKIFIPDDNSTIEDHKLLYCSPMEFTFEQFKQLFGIDAETKINEDKDYFNEVYRSTSNIPENNIVVLNKEKLEKRIVELSNIDQAALSG